MDTPPQPSRTPARKHHYLEALITNIPTLILNAKVDVRRTLPEVRLISESLELVNSIARLAGVLISYIMRQM